MNMTTTKTMVTTILVAAFLTAPLAGLAADAKDKKPKPYPLDT